MRSLLAVLKSRRLLAVTLLGFSSGLPLALTGATLQAWMKTEGVDLTVIGLFSLVGMPYGFKFVWAPLMDRFVPPLFGRRRGWILLMQLALAVSIAALAFSQPAKAPAATAFIAVLACFFSASQDIAIDAYRSDVLEKDELGPGAAFSTGGYRMAMLVSGSVALIMADHVSWPVVYCTMAAAMGVGIAATFFAPEPRVAPAPPRSLQEAVAHPFSEFFKRTGSLEMLAFILLYKVDVVMATALMTPFILELGFSKTDIGAVSKSVGMIATIVGALAGGALMVRLGVKRSLWTFGLFQGVSTIAFMLLAHVGHHYPTMVVSIAAENFCSGMGTAAFQAFLMNICDKRFTATQYALFSSMFALTRTIGAAPTGFIVKALGWQAFFLVCIVAMIPGLLLLTRYDRWTRPEIA
ncbi:MAG: AmpG family muropeptide MFS transporter [Elusimicrobia bacterium]|nr:AmpG family muropeptide MFS transporter [Elusimicrobiota bacterium]